MKYKIVDKIWGKEKWICNNELYCSKILTLNKGYRCSIHYHKNKDETFYILDGKVKLELFGKTIIMNKGDSIRLKPNAVHRFTGLTHSKVLEVSTHHEEQDSHRLKKSGKMETKNETK